MSRLKGFDYKSPYFYMVTLKRLKGLAAFSEIGPNGLIENEITRAFAAIISGFHAKWRCCEKISPFVIMPDHLHLLFKIRAIPDRVALGVLVSQLAKGLRNAYWQVVAPDAATGNTPPVSPSHAVLSGAGSAGWVGASGFAGCASAQPRSQSREAPPFQSCETPTPRPIFEKDWHDWIVKKEGQLAAFRRYIRENPARAALRRTHAHFFQQVAPVDFLGRRWFAYGNRALLDLPVLVPFKGHRATAEGSPEWNALVESAARIGPGDAPKKLRFEGNIRQRRTRRARKGARVGVSTFMSPLEKVCGNAIARAGGGLVVLSPEGFGPRWHPPHEKERFCAAGRMLFLSLYEATARQPTRKELYDRCHEMVDLAQAGLQ